MKMLVATDGSPYAERALEYAMKLSSALKDASTITLVTAHYAVPSARARAMVGQEILDRYYHDEMEAALAPARESLTRAGQTADEVRVIGDPGGEVARCANSGGYDMVIMGTHGRTALGNLVMGSVATRVIAEATIPVVLVK